MRICLVYIMLSMAFTGCAKAQSPIEVVDGRQENPWRDLSTWATHPPLEQAFEAARTHWRGQDPSYEEDVHVLAVAEGAFTQPDVEQQAVLFVMSLWPRCCPKTGLALLEGDRLVRNVAFEGLAEDLVAVPDLDDDGRDELFTIGSFGMGGQESRMLTLLHFGEEGLVERGSTSIYDSTCASGLEESRSTAARLLALPGLTFMMEQYAQAMCGEETWELVSGPEPFVFEPSSSHLYADLPVKKAP